MANWSSGGFSEWIIGNTAFLSVVFSWKLHEAYGRAVWHKSLGRHVRAGGPAVALNPGALADVAEIGGKINALPHHNLDATFTSRGCIRRCPFCAVPKIEGALVELDDWEPRPIICDNNLLVTSRAHFDSVIDRLKPIKKVDFNQGLDARLLTTYHARRLTELDLHCVRLAWDNSRYESSFMRAFDILINAGIPANKIHVYCLIGFDDTPGDALYRLETITRLGAKTNPMRYQPLDCVVRNQYVSPNWTDPQLKDFMRYWSRTDFWLRIGIKFDEYDLNNTVARDAPQWTPLNS